NIKQVDLHFASDWPLIQQVSASLAFIGRKIIIDMDHAESLGIPLQKVHGVIPTVGGIQPPMLNIQSEVPIQTDLANGLKYIHASPLDQSIGKVFAGADGKGSLKLTLGLNIPLYNPNKTKVQGDLSLVNSEINFVPWNFKLTHLAGRILFTENSV